MGMITTMPWSSNKVSHSFKIKKKMSLKNDPKRSNRYDFRHAELTNLRKQYEIADKHYSSLAKKL
jgi:hypothetical protein